MLIQFQSSAKTQPSEQQLEKLCAWIDSHIDEAIGWPELTKQSGWISIRFSSSFLAISRPHP